MTQPISRVGVALVLIVGSYFLGASPLEAQEVPRPVAPAVVAPPSMTESTVVPAQAFGSGVSIYTVSGIAMTPKDSNVAHGNYFVDAAGNRTGVGHFIAPVVLPTGSLMTFF